MSLEISEDLVSLAYQSLGYFVIEGRKVGLREIDLLALRLGEDGEVAERLHVEIQIAVNPIGVLRPKPAIGSSARRAKESARDWMEKKFKQARILQAVSQAFHERPYRRVLVHGALKDPRQVDVIRALGIECVTIGHLVQRAMKQGDKNRLHRAVGIAQLLAE